MSKNNGGPAFPINILGETIKGQEGMTLRDYFAAKAMQAFYTNYENSSDAKEASARAYVIADAMLAEREKDNEVQN